MPAAPLKTDVVVLGLGSNVGDRLAQLRSAVAQLQVNDIHVLSRSRVYRTAPVGPAQPDFFNAAVRVSTALAPASLLRVTMGIERQLGRSRPDAVRWGPRTIDIDVLWYAGGAVADANLQVPHPRLTGRSFALLPLLDVCADATDPGTGTAYRSLPAAQVALICVGQL